MTWGRKGMLNNGRLKGGGGEDMTWGKKGMLNIKKNTKIWFP